MKNITSFPIPTASLPSFEKKVVSLNRKALRLNFPTIGFSISNTRLEEQVVKNSEQSSFEKGEIRHIEVCDVTFDEVSLGFEDYKLIGLTTTEDGISLLHNFTKGEDRIDLSEERGTCACDHCGSNRRRNKVFFVQEKGKTDFVRVGSTCIRDFFPKDSGDILGKFQFVEELFEFFNEGGDGFSDGGVSYYKVEEVLALTCRLAREVGYVSGKMAELKCISGTKSGVQTILGDPRESSETTDKDKEKAQAILGWFEAKEESSDFFDNCQPYVDAGYCRLTKVGYIVGIYGCWNHFTQEREAAKVSTSEHIGIEGEKQDFKGTITDVTCGEGMYRTWHRTSINCEGNMVTYFNLLRIKDLQWDDLDDFKGLEVSFSARIKEHKEFRGIKQTQIQRATKVTCSNLPVAAV